MEKKNNDRVLAYQVATSLNQEVLSQVSGGAQTNSSVRVVLTGDHTSPDVVIQS